MVVPKPSGEVRICVDLTKFNANIKRKVHPLPSVDYNLGKVEVQGFSQSLVQSLLSGKESYQKNQSCSQSSSPLGADIALKDCPMESPLAQNNSKTSWKANKKD